MTASKPLCTLLIFYSVTVLFTSNTANSQNIFNNLTKDQGQISDYLSVDSLSNSISKETGYEIWYKSLDINKDDVKGFFDRAMGKIEKSLFKEAIIDLERIISIDSAISSAYSFKGFCQFMLHETDSAAYNINKALELDSLNTTAYYARGRICFADSKYQEARSAFTKALELNDKEPGSAYFLGLIAIYENDPKTAQTCFKRAISAAPEYVEPYIGLCSVYASQGQKTNALKTLDDARQYLEGNSNYYLVRANLQFMFANYQKTLEECTNCLNIDPRNYLALLTRGIVCALQKDYSGGFTDLKMAITDSTFINHIQITDETKKSFLSRTNTTKSQLLADSRISDKSRKFYQSGFCKYITGDYTGAYADFSRVIETDNTVAEPFELRGRILMKKGDLVAAGKDFENAIQLSGGTYFSFINLAEICYHLNDLRRINKYLIAALKFEPENPEIYKILATLNHNNPIVAITYYNKVLELQPFNDDILLENAKLKKDNGFPREAIIDYRKLIAGYPKNSENYLVIADIFASLNELDSARIALEEVCTIDPNNYEPFLMLARMYSIEKDYKKAVYYYSEAKKRNISSYISLEMGIQYENQKKYQEAVNEFNGIIKLIKNEQVFEKKVLANTYYHLGICYDSIADQDKALKNYDLAIDVRPDDPQCYISRGDLFRRIKKFDLSMKDYTKSLSLDSAFYPAYISIGKQYEETSEPDKAIHYFQKAIGIDSSISVAYIELCKTYFMTKDYANSAFYGAKAYSKDNSSPEGLFYESLSELYLGETESSRSKFQSFIQLNCKTNLFTNQKLNDYLDTVIPEKPEAKELKQILIDFSCN
jgi:tetratricopeptide (TPR) repeat protein